MLLWGQEEFGCRGQIKKKNYWNKHTLILTQGKVFIGIFIIVNAKVFFGFNIFFLYLHFSGTTCKLELVFSDNFHISKISFFIFKILANI